MTADADPIVLKLFIDQCVPDSVGKTFQAAGHTVVFLRETIPSDSPDELVAAVAESNEAILISLDGDFKRIASRQGIGQRKYRKLSLIKLSCREAAASERIRLAMSLIEHEWRFSIGSTDRRIFIEIGNDVIRTFR